MAILKTGEKQPRRQVCQSTYSTLLDQFFSVLVRHLYAFKKIYSYYRIYVHCVDDTALCKESVCLFICFSVVLPRDFYATIVGK